jgi:hypothetical protein
VGDIEVNDLPPGDVLDGKAEAGFQARLGQKKTGWLMPMESILRDTEQGDSTP